jgi:polyhydroxybutyrate depolymerase
VAVQRDVDDLAYLRDVVADVATQIAIDPGRVTVVGFSNGGMMALRAACELPDVFSRAVSVAGPLVAPCPNPLVAMHIYGTLDQLVPPRGGFSTFTGTTFPDTLTEPQRLPAGSRDDLVPFVGGHKWPTADDGVDGTGRTLDFLLG